jgi:SagB-type dehydrogenase family enzyme
MSGSAETSGAEQVAGVQTVTWEPWIVGTAPTLDDPTETYHEVSRLVAGRIEHGVPGLRLLGSRPELRVSATRSVKRHPQRPAVALPAPQLGPASLAEAIARRRSHRSFGSGAIELSALATILDAAYGVTGAIEGTSQALRTVPSGGALYPLELYVLALRVERLEGGLYHYDPLRHVLEHLRAADGDCLRALSPYGDVVERCSALVLLTGMFWRSRFKYGARAYRFTLLEAGHLAQNLLLAATVLGLASVPIGGFYDRCVDRMLGIDGLAEASLYLVPIGERAT